MDEKSHVMEDLYYNTFFRDRIPFQLDREKDNLKYGVYTTYPNLDELRRAFKTKIWITNSPDGFVLHLRELLEQHYNL